MDGAAPAPHPDLAGRDRRPVFSGKRGFHLRCHHRACRHRRGAPGSSAMSKALRIGLIGAGWATQYHLQGWQKLAGNASVVAITDPSAENAAARANEFGLEQRLAAAWIREGRIGAITAARLTLMTSGTLPDSEGKYPAIVRQPFMRTETRMLVAEVLIHHLDTLCMLLGPLDVTAATLTQTCADIAGEDGAVIQMLSQGGAGVSLFASFAAHGAPASQPDHLEILGKAGAIR